MEFEEVRLPWLQEEQQEPVDFLTLIHVPEWKTILTDLVKGEKMDPWNIDISELAEKYLQKIKAMEEMNLRIPANAMLASAILLKFKAKKLKIASIEELEEEAEQEFKQKEKLFLDFEPVLSNPKTVREGRVSLESLVESIEGMLEKSKKKALLGRELKEVEYKLPYSETNIEEILEEVYEAVANNIDSTGIARFSDITIGKDSLKRIDYFIALLFLSNKNKINAWQEEFFGEIFISLNGN